MKLPAFNDGIEEVIEKSSDKDIRKYTWTITDTEDNEDINYLGEPVEKLELVIIADFGKLDEIEDDEDRDSWDEMDEWVIENYWIAHTEKFGTSEDELCYIATRNEKTAALFRLSDDMLYEIIGSL